MKPCDDMLVLAPARVCGDGAMAETLGQGSQPKVSAKVSIKVGHSPMRLLVLTPFMYIPAHFCLCLL